MKYLCIGVLLFSLLPYLFATNGMFMISNNARAAGMGGTEIAVPSDCSAISANPANIASICSRSFSISTALLMPQVEMETTTTGQEHGKDQVFPIPLFAFGDRFGNSPWAYAVGFYFQGGMGAQFDKYDVTGFGHEGSLKSNLSFGKFSPTIAYNILPNLSFGASFELGYSRLDVDFLPQLAAPPFGGFELQKTEALSYGGRFGLYCQLNEQIAVGFVYTMKTPVNFDGDFKQRGQSTVDGEFVGMNWPHIFEMGISYAPRERLLLACDVSYINWDESVNWVTVKRDGDTYMKMPMHWRDQLVISVGAEYAIGDNHKIRVGYNYGNNPIPEETLNPLFPAITEHHITVGYGYSDGNFGFDIAYEHAMEASDVSQMPPLFNNYNISHAQHSVYMAFKYHF